MKSNRKRAPSKGTAFVPRMVFQSLFVGLVPAIAVGCASTAGGDAQADSATDQGQIITLAVIGFDADADSGRDATSDVPDVLGVADVGFDAGPPDHGIIVLAQIGFEIDPEAQPDTLVASTRAPSGEKTNRTPRRGRA